MEADLNDKVSVNHMIDLKGPLKGKGGSLAQWRKDAADRLEDVYREMTLLADESKSVEGRTFGLYLYGQRDGRQLRWRMKSSAHATWQRIEPLLAKLPQGLSQWYVQAQEVAQILNHREQVLRYELKTVERLISGGTVRAYREYRSSVGRGKGGGRPAGTKKPPTQDGING